MNTYRTRHQGLTAALRYSLGPDAHLRTFLEPKGATFEFADDGECAGICRQFFAGAFGVTDARAFIDAFFEIRNTLSVAIDAGEWRNK